MDPRPLLGCRPPPAPPCLPAQGCLSQEAPRPSPAHGPVASSADGLMVCKAPCPKDVRSAGITPPSPSGGRLPGSPQEWKQRPNKGDPEGSLTPITLRHRRRTRKWPLSAPGRGGLALGPPRLRGTWSLWCLSLRAGSGAVAQGRAPADWKAGRRRPVPELLGSEHPRGCLGYRNFPTL